MHLDAPQTAILDSVGVGSWEDVDSLVRNFPSLARHLPLPQLSFAAVNALDQTYSNLATKAEMLAPRAEFGALPPAGAPISMQAVVGLPSALPMARSITAQQTIDLRRTPWPVRNQNPRGTCVAFGSTACVEHFRAGGGVTPDLSEQFLYWAIKTNTNDPNKHQDGTWLEFARDALAADGICDEALCRYVNKPLVPNAAGPKPSAAAQKAAVKQVTTTHLRNPGPAAKLVLGLLGEGRPVAICLPVFGDPAAAQHLTNWTTAVGWNYGRVLNPPPTSTVVGGHCVCITGFVPDTDEDTGGYFVIRNSWDVTWGALNPSPGHSHGPERGYGDVSATYVDRYCWELFQL